MAPTKLEIEDHSRDAAFNEAMHKTSSAATGGFSAMLKKDKKAHQAAVDGYFKHWENKHARDETTADRESRKAEYATLTRLYYDIGTDLYEYGWGQSLHFCRFGYGEGFLQAIARHEHYLAAKIGIKAGDRVLDVGCGVGGPARQIAKFTGAHITGLNNNNYQIDRATRYAQKEGLSEQLDFVKGDFMQMSFPANSFDHVYSIEATVHAPSLEGVYSEIYRVFKPGGVFGVYEWLMTDRYDNSDTHQREIRVGIEQGNGISNMVTISEALTAIRAAGFELELHEDLSRRPDATPWYYPIAGEFQHIGSLFDIYRIGRMTRAGRGLAHTIIGAMEMLGLAPSGTRKTADSMALAADCLVAGAKEGLFTPMYLMVARKPTGEDRTRG